MGLSRLYHHLPSGSIILSDDGSHKGSILPRECITAVRDQICHIRALPFIDPRSLPLHCLLWSTIRSKNYLFINRKDIISSSYIQFVRISRIEGSGTLSA